MSTNLKKSIFAKLPEEIIDKILSYNGVGVNIIIAFGLQNIYIEKYCNIIKNPATSDLKKITCLWRLGDLVNFYKYEMNFNQLDNLPKKIWCRLSFTNLKESFIIQNSHNLNLAIIKYYKIDKFSHKFHLALPDFKNINKCTHCFKNDAICKKKYI